MEREGHAPRCKFGAVAASVPTKAGRRAAWKSSAVGMMSPRSGCDQTAKRCRRNDGANRESGRRPKSIPKRARNDTRDEHRDAARKIEYAERRPAQFHWCAISHEGGEQSLGKPHVKAPNHDTENQERNRCAKSENKIGDNQKDDPE